MGYCSEDRTMKRGTFMARVVRVLRSGWSWWIPAGAGLLFVVSYIANQLARGSL